MNDMQTYPTRKAAQAEIDKMVGWDAKPVKLTGYDANGNPADVWAIQVKALGASKHSAPMFMRTDGYVR